MKNMKQQTKKPNKFLTAIKDILVALFSNNRVVDSSKTNKWWVGLILAVIAVVLPVLPVLTTYANASGSNFINAKYTYEFKDDLVFLSSALSYNDEITKNYNLEGKSIDFKVKEDNTLAYFENNVETDHLYSGDINNNLPIAQRIKKDADGKERISLEIYYYSDDFNDTIAAVVDALGKRQFYVGTTNLCVEPTKTDVLYTPNFMVLFKKGMYTAVYQTGTTTLVGVRTGTDWKHTPQDVFLLKDRLLTVDKMDKDVLNPIYVDGVYKNWMKLFNETYISSRNYNTMFFSLLYLGVYTILLFVMGLLLFLLTRGKKNMFNYLKFIDCQKMAWWAALCPGLLAMIIGFLLPQFASMLFIVLLGIRVMWLSMKQLKPAY